MIAEKKLLINENFKKHYIFKKKIEYTFIANGYTDINIQDYERKYDIK